MPPVGKAKIRPEPSPERAAHAVIQAIEALRAGVSPMRTEYQPDDAVAVQTSIRAGIDAAIWSQLRAVGFTTGEIATVVGVNERTIARKQARAERLDVAEGDRTMRLAHLALETARAFGDLAKALRWLRKTNRTLGGEKPLDLIATEPGTALVRRALGTIEYGGIA